MKTFTYCGKIIKTPGDLEPKGVKSTCNYNKLPFNQTYKRLWKLISTLR